MNVLQPSPIGSLRRTAVFALCCLVMLGCSKKTEENTEAPNSQIVARIGDDVVTTQELDNEFRLARVPTDRRKEPAVIKQVLGEVVTRKYVARKALDAKLDREPTVLLDLLRARDIVLANAQESRVLTRKSSSISRADVDSHIANNPLKFAERQIATIDQIVAPANALSQAATDATKDRKSLDEVEQNLTAMGISHARSVGNLSSSELAPDFFNRIKEKRPDDVFFVRAGQNGVFFKVNALESRPLQGDDALNAARQDMQMELLKSEASMSAVEANLAAKYEGNYAAIMSEQVPAAAK
jgi:EpsD family peptidyl-prolyl cis-trans isomerase